MEKYDKIISLNNLEYKIILIQELFFLKSCYVYYYLYKKTEDEMNVENNKISSNLLKLNPNFIRNSCIKLYYLTYLYNFRKLMYNYYLYGFYSWIENTMRRFSNKINFIRKIITAKWFTETTIFEQNEYNLIINKKNNLFFLISNSILELQNFYDNNSDIHRFTTNKLMNTLRRDDETNIHNKMLLDIVKKINVPEDKNNFTVINNTYDESNSLFECIINAMKNKYNINDIPYYNISIINKINENNITEDTLKELKKLIIDGFQFKINYYNLTKPANWKKNILNENGINDLTKIIEYLESYLKSDKHYSGEFMINVISGILNCTFFIYNENNLKPIFSYENNVYNIILKENGNLYNLIKYNDNIAMTCDKLPEELQIYKYCYNEISSNIIVGGASDI